ncbi:TPA: ankyrin repeat domain-containing protein [Enterobacter cloacae]|uniref:ankyrin repeat domain-containing protein n=1 Tax=Enterobacter cloacae TaxID=550 RepID=UPI002A83B454|nr:ankyrin repeat domain-containing protein [Enterobacter cloacae]
MNIKKFFLKLRSKLSRSHKKIKEIWFFCERCLSDNECKPDNIKQSKTITIPSRDEALSLAVTTANTEVVYFFLVNKAKANVNGVTGGYNETQLIIAAYYGTKKHKEIAEFLLSHGANINATDLSSNSTALLTAIWKNNIDFAKFLLQTVQTLL